MRNLYAARLEALQEAAHQYLAGALDISSIRAGLSTAGILRNGMTSSEAEGLATANGLEVLGLHRFFLGKSAVEGLLLGFAGFTEREIRRGVRVLAKALETVKFTTPCGISFDRSLNNELLLSVSNPDSLDTTWSSKRWSRSLRRSGRFFDEFEWYMTAMKAERQEQILLTDFLFRIAQSQGLEANVHPGYGRVTTEGCEPPPLRSGPGKRPSTWARNRSL
jgi:hypothetical protein